MPDPSDQHENTSDAPRDPHARGRLRTTIQAYLSEGPPTLSDLHQRLDDLSRFTSEIALDIAVPLIRERANAMPLATFDDKKTFASWLNGELRRAGLALRCPRTGLPVTLEATTGYSPLVGRFRLDYLDAQGHHRKTYVSADCPPLEFVADSTVTRRGRVRPSHGRG